jgi:hypothetical protein
MSDPTIYAQLAAMEKRLKALERQESGGLSGTWTVGLAGSGGGGVFTVTQSGVYVRLGSHVLISGFIQITAFTSAPAGNLLVTGLPFAAAANSPLASSGYNLNLAAGAIDLGSETVNGTTQIALLENYDNADTTAVSAALLANGKFIRVGGSYIAA